MPGIVGPVSAAKRFLRRDSANVGVQNSHHVGHPVHAVLTDDSQQSHTAPEFHGAGAGASGLLDHLWLIAIGLQTPSAFFSTVSAGNGDHRAGDVVVGLIPGHPDQAVGAPGIKLVGIPQRWVIRKRGKPIIGPLLPALANHGVFEPVGSVDPSVHGEPLTASPRIPGSSGLVTIDVGDIPAVVVLLGAQHYPALNKGPHPARMGVVRGAYPGKAAVITVLVLVHLLPVPVGVFFQRIYQLTRRHQSAGGEGTFQV